MEQSDLRHDGRSQHDEISNPDSSNHQSAANLSGNNIKVQFGIKDLRKK
jgi:hypothetical protein